MTSRNAVSVVTVAVSLVTDQRSVQGQIDRANDRKLVLCLALEPLRAKLSFRYHSVNIDPSYK